VGLGDDVSRAPGLGQAEAALECCIRMGVGVTGGRRGKGGYVRGAGGDSSCPISNNGR
jgi:hypothetical protein